MKTQRFFVLVLFLLVALGGVAGATACPEPAEGTLLSANAQGGTSTLGGEKGPLQVRALAQAQGPIVIDHTCTDLSKVPAYWIEQAKKQLRVSYGHTSHGSQPITGMDILMADPTNGDLYDFNTNGAIVSGTLSIANYTPSGDLGNPDRVTWEARTREYLDGSGSDRNVVVWSWCGQAGTASEEDIDTYLSLMNGLEQDYPDVTFVYMTGHLDGNGVDGNLYARNNQIRDYCLANDKILFDFADIESYDPDGNYYPDESDGCAWCSDWCSTHQCPACLSDCAHSHCFNCYNKGQAFWWMMARIAGWDGGDSHKTASTESAVYGETITYTVVIRGLDAPPTATVHLTDVLPAELAYVPGTLDATSGLVNDAGDPTLRWTGILTPTPVVTITYAASMIATEPQVVANSAVIAAPGYQTITRTTAVSVTWAPGWPDLRPSYKAVSPPFADYGERITYTVVLRSATGPLTHTVYLTDVIQAGLAYVPGSLAATSGSVIEAGAPTLRWSGLLTPTSAVTVTYAATATFVYSGTSTLVLPQAITNTALVAVPGYPTLSRTAIVRTNWRHVYLPLLLRN